MAWASPNAAGAPAGGGRRVGRRSHDAGRRSLARAKAGGAYRALLGHGGDRCDCGPFRSRLGRPQLARGGGHARRAAARGHDRLGAPRRGSAIAAARGRARAQMTEAQPIPTPDMPTPVDETPDLTPPTPVATPEPPKLDPVPVEPTQTAEELKPDIPPPQQPLEMKVPDLPKVDDAEAKLASPPPPKPKAHREPPPKPHEADRKKPIDPTSRSSARPRRPRARWPCARTLRPPLRPARAPHPRSRRRPGRAR